MSNSSPGFSILADGAFLKVADRRLSLVPSINQATIFSEEEALDLMAWVEGNIDVSRIEKVEHGRISAIGADIVITYSHS